MEELGGVSSSWSWEENKLFELALAVVDENTPERWNVVAAMIGGKSAEEVEKHYEILVDDLQSIESGEMDHSLELYVAAESNQSTCWNDEDQKFGGIQKSGFLYAVLQQFFSTAVKLRSNWKPTAARGFEYKIGFPGMLSTSQVF